ncbi:MAG: hypothetical protein IJS03_07965 [Eubacterium sp.]|nr:hypothetical protein [Eubacterium sp.]
MKILCKKSLSLFLAVLLLFSLFTFAPTSAYAKSGVSTTKAVYLKNKKTYKKYDLNGDGRADKIKVRYKTYAQADDGVAHAYVYINGKKRKTFTGGAQVKVRLIAPTKKKVFIVPEYRYKGGTADAYIYRYKNKKVKKCRRDSIYYPFSAGKITKVSKNRIYLKVSTTDYERGLIEDNYKFPASFKLIYKINGYKIKRKSDFLKAYNNSYFVHKDFTTSEDPEYKNYDGIRVKINETVKITRCYVLNGYNASYEIECDDGERGWIVDDDFANGENPYLY